MANGVTSEWEDIHVKLGNYLPREKVKTGEEIFNENIEKESKKDPMASKSLEQLKIEQEENNNSDDDEIFEEYKRKKIAEMEEYTKKPKFVGLREIRRQDYVQEMNEAPKGVYVVLLLYDNSINDSRILENILIQLSKKNPTVKFLKIDAYNCIEKIEEFNIPAIIIYYNGKLVQQLFPATVFFGGKGKMTLKSIFFFIS